MEQRSQLLLLEGGALERWGSSQFLRSLGGGSGPSLDWGGEANGMNLLSLDDDAHFHCLADGSLTLNGSVTYHYSYYHIHESLWTSIYNG